MGFNSTNKSYRAIRHDITRAKQKKNADELHHPDEKINQMIKVFKELDYKIGGNISILEFFCR